MWPVGRVAATSREASQRWTRCQNRFVYGTELAHAFLKSLSNLFRLVLAR